MHMDVCIYTISIWLGNADYVSAFVYFHIYIDVCINCIFINWPINIPVIYELSTMIKKKILFRTYSYMFIYLTVTYTNSNRNRNTNTLTLDFVYAVVHMCSLYDLHTFDSKFDIII